MAYLDFRVGGKFEYDYDFGNDWEHEIRVEKIEPMNIKYRFPTYIEGMRACLPEECGGPFFMMKPLRNKNAGNNLCWIKLGVALEKRNFLS